MTGRTNDIEVADRFPKDTNGFVLTVLHEDGEYRHLRFQRPGERWGSTDIHTWPGGLTTSGDMADGWMFERGLGFFAGRPNLHYWQEKLSPRCRRASKEFSETTLRSELTLAAGDLEVPEHHREAFDTELDDLISTICSHYADTTAALAQIDDFTFDCEGEDGEELRLSFSDPYELDVEDYTFPFVWACQVLSTAAQWMAEADSRIVRPGHTSA